MTPLTRETTSWRRPRHLDTKSSKIRAAKSPKYATRCISAASEVVPPIIVTLVRFSRLADRSRSPPALEKQGPTRRCEGDS